MEINETIKNLQEKITKTKSWLLSNQDREIKRIRASFEQEATKSCDTAMMRALDEGKSIKEQQKACDDIVKLVQVRYMQMEFEYLQEILKEEKENE